MGGNTVIDILDVGRAAGFVINKGITAIGKAFNAVGLALYMIIMSVNDRMKIADCLAMDDRSRCSPLGFMLDKPSRGTCKTRPPKSMNFGILCMGPENGLRNRLSLKSRGCESSVCTEIPSTFVHGQTVS